MNLISGIKYPPFDFCPKHCTTTKLCLVPMMEVDITSVNETLININFNEEVVIARTNLVKFDLTTSLTYLGGNMGLWLGLGVIQIMDVITNTVSHLYDRKSK